MSTKVPTSVTRRRMIQSTAMLAAAPMVVPSSVFGANAPSNRITMACIGVRGQGNSNMRRFLGIEECQVLAVCDVNQKVLDQRSNDVNKRYKNKDCKSYKDYRELMQRDDIDSVMIATPDQWHAPIGITAARAGKDIFCEKPITHTHAEGKMLVKEVQKAKRIWQTGSWQRSQFHFHRAVETIMNGHIGELQHVDIGLPNGNPHPPNAADNQTPPAELDYDFWLGPAQEQPYMKERLDFNWRWNYNIGGGQMMDWIGHHNDIAHWAMGEQYNGPILVHSDRMEFPRDKRVWDAAYRYDVHCRYASGVTTRITNLTRMGCTFLGSDGWLRVWRGGLIGSNSKQWRDKNWDPGPKKAYKSTDHWRDFINACKTRKDAVTTVEISHRSITPGHIGLISHELGRKKLKYDPKEDKIVGNDDAIKLMEQKGTKGIWRPWREKYAGPLLEKKA